MKMKNAMFIVAMMTSTVIFAQSKASDPGERAIRQTERMKSILLLDDAQYASIKGINQKYAEKHSAFRNADTADREQKQKTMRDLQRERENEISAVLSPEQKTKWDAHKKEQMENRQKSTGKKSSTHGERMKTELALSDEQFNKVQELNGDFKNRVNQLRNSGEGDEARRKIEYQKIKTERDAALKNILSPEQYEKWNTMKNDKTKKHSRKK
jgi:Spy/CpxP family protein refolding chaperone